MPELIYIKGDITKPIQKNIVIAHIVNDIGLMGSGVAKALYTKWPSVKSEYLEWYKVNHPGYPFELGRISIGLVDDENHIEVANMIAQHSIISKGEEKPIRYTALIKCLEELNEYCYDHKKTIHMPKIGSGLSRGNWNVIEEIIKETMKVDVYIYEI